MDFEPQCLMGKECELYLSVLSIKENMLSS